jgi:hypothetical protein
LNLAGLLQDVEAYLVGAALLGCARITADYPVGTVPRERT